MGLRPGLCQRAGQTGVITGLDWTAAAGPIGRCADPERLDALLAEFERGMVTGAAKQAQADAATPKEDTADGDLPPEG